MIACMYVSSISGRGTSNLLKQCQFYISLIKYFNKYQIKNYLLFLFNFASLSKV